MLWQDGATVAQDGFFVGYNALVWLTILLQALGGLVVSVCIAYADNLLPLSHEKPPLDKPTSRLFSKYESGASSVSREE